MTRQTQAAPWLVSAGRGISVVAGLIASECTARVHAGDNINPGSITIQDSVDATRNAKNFTRFGQSQHIGSQVSAAADIPAARPV